MKTQAVAIKRSTWISVILVGFVIAYCSITDVRAAVGPTEITHSSQ